MKVRKKVKYEMHFSGASDKCRASIDYETGVLTLDMGILGNALLLSTEVKDLYYFIREHHPMFLGLDV